MKRKIIHFFKFETLHSKTGGEGITILVWIQTGVEHVGPRVGGELSPLQGAPSTSVPESLVLNGIAGVGETELGDSGRGSGLFPCR